MRLEETTQRLAALEGDVRELAGRLDALVAGLDPRGSTLQIQRVSELRRVLRRIRHRLAAARTVPNPAFDTPRPRDAVARVDGEDKTHKGGIRPDLVLSASTTPPVAP